MIFNVEINDMTLKTESLLIPIMETAIGKPYSEALKERMRKQILSYLNIKLSEDIMKKLDWDITSSFSGKVMTLVANDYFTETILRNLVRNENEKDSIMLV